MGSMDLWGHGMGNQLEGTCQILRGADAGDWTPTGSDRLGVR